MKRKERLGQRRGFTIVELVAVIAIIGVLAVVLVPTLVGGGDRFQDILRKPDRKADKGQGRRVHDKNGHPERYAY